MCHCERDRLWVGFPQTQKKNINIFISALWCRGKNGVEFHSTRIVSRIRREMGNRVSSAYHTVCGIQRELKKKYTNLNLHVPTDQRTIIARIITINNINNFFSYTKRSYMIKLPLCMSTMGKHVTITRL